MKVYFKVLFYGNTCYWDQCYITQNILPLVLSINVSPFHKTVNEACTCPISASYEYWNIYNVNQKQDIMHKKL